VLVILTVPNLWPGLTATGSAEAVWVSEQHCESIKPQRASGRAGFVSSENPGADGGMGSGTALTMQTRMCRLVGRGHSAGGGSMHKMARISENTGISRSWVPAPQRHYGGPQRATVKDHTQRWPGALAAHDRAGRSAVPDDPGSPTTLGGRVLEPALQAEMGACFGYDFSKVRVHADPSSYAAASAYRAHAYTHGTDIFFGEGSYQPHSADGRRLVAHELAHIVQQSSVSGSTAQTAHMTTPGDATELEAERAASAVMAYRSPEVTTRLSSGPLVQRQAAAPAAAAPAKAPASMSIANVSGPTPADCGSFSWKVNFKLPTASLAGGHFVQELKITRNATDCKGAAMAGCKLAHHYWEAWHVKAGGTQDS
jgi:hypothetical protein